MIETVEEIQKKQSFGKIEVENLGVSYDQGNNEDFVFKGINFKTSPGEFLCLLGPSGCGKSTILNSIAQFIKPTQGFVFVNDRHVDTPGSDRGFVFQESSLLPWKTTIQNVEFGLKLRSTSKRKRRELANYYLKQVGLYSYRNHFPSQLSGGMQQRASILRALVNFPSVLLMDEPFGALDAQTRITMQELLLKIWNQFKPTIVFVTHDISEAIFLADRIFVMGVNPGRIKQEINIPLERPRQMEVMHSQEFLTFNRDIFNFIREEVR